MYERQREEATIRKEVKERTENRVTTNEVKNPESRQEAGGQFSVRAGSRASKTVQTTPN